MAAGNLPPQEDNSSDLENSEGSKTVGGPLALLLPAESRIWKELRKLVVDKNARVEQLASLASQDPVIVLELLRVANAMYFSGGRPPITTSQMAIQRLGSDVVQENLEKLAERPPIEDPRTSYWVEFHRSRCKRTGIVAKILAEPNSRTLRDDCQSAASMLYIGEMIAAAYLQEKYVELADEQTRSALNYRLAQDYKFDVEKMTVNYLTRHGLPDDLMFAIDRDGRSKRRDRAIIKPLVSASAEMVEAFDNNRWEKLAPGKKLPPMSALRIIQFNDAQYLKVYERIAEYLFAAKVEEERRASASEAESDFSETIEFQESAPEDNELEADIQNLLGNSQEDDAEDETTASKATKNVEPVVPPSAKRTTKGHDLKEDREVIVEAFSLSNAGSSPDKSPRINTTQIITPPQMRMPESNKFVDEMVGWFDEAKNSEQLLSDLLQKLIDEGPFVRTALIVVSKERDNAIVVASRGPDIGNGQKLVLDDPLSPLAKCFSKVQSFGSSRSTSSPWGSKAFALSPIDVDHSTPVALYADCGDERGLPFEARRIFRNMVDLLNQKLPQIPGGIPVEI